MDVCDCIEVVAVEAYDMFVGLLLKHVGAYSGGDAMAFCSPPAGAAYARSRGTGPPVSGWTRPPDSVTPAAMSGTG